jgi:hypothetical protein
LEHFQFLHFPFQALFPFLVLFLFLLLLLLLPTVAKRRKHLNGLRVQSPGNWNNSDSIH